MRHIRTRAVIATAAALIAAGTITAGVSTASPEAKSTKPTNAEIAGLFNGWKAALATGDPEVVADRYASDAVLLPTLSPVIRTDRAGIIDYMEGFLAKKPVATKVQTVIKVLDNNEAIDTGLYEFQLTDPDTGVVSTVEARYTFEYEKVNGHWLIENHHSSVLPAAS